MPERPLPNYEVVPLRSEEIRVAAVQSRLRTIDPTNAERGKRENLEHMLWLVDYAQARTCKDLVAFHEFPLGGLDRGWSRDQSLKAAIDIPGPETDAIAQKAKQYRCYIEFGCYARLPDWPRHFVNTCIIIGPGGDIVYRRWWLRNLSGAGYGTSVYDVLDEYVKRYGWVAVFPVARTDIGNIAMMSEVLEPELRRAFAMKGAEIGIHYMVSGVPEMDRSARPPERAVPAARMPEGRHVFRTDFEAACMVNHIYGLFVINAVSEENGMMLDPGVGNSAIYDCNGNVLAEASSHHETVVEALIPIGAYRRTHSIPRFHKALFRDLYEKYEPKVPPNSYLEALPENRTEATALYRKRAGW